jgi:hypothetical protein
LALFYFHSTTHCHYLLLVIVGLCIVFPARYRTK